MTIFYHEALIMGTWSPRTTPEPLAVVVQGGKTYEKRAECRGHEVRAMTPIAPGHEGLTLDQLRQCYGPGGCFYATTKGERENAEAK